MKQSKTKFRYYNPPISPADLSAATEPQTDMMHEWGTPTFSAMQQVACNVRGDRYIYMPDLLELDSHTGTPSWAACQPEQSPLVLSAWERALANHPDPDFRSFILQGLTHGFHIGFDRHAESAAFQLQKPCFLQGTP